MKGYTGIEWSRKEQCFKAYIMLNKKKTLVGVFVEEVDAAKARDRAILKHNLNIPLQVLRLI